MKVWLERFKGYTENVEVYTTEVCEGVWLLYVDFDDRLRQHATGSSGGTDASIYFGMQSETLVAVHYDCGVNTIEFGQVGKRHYHATIYREDIYEKLINALRLHPDDPT